MLEDE